MRFKLFFVIIFLASVFNVNAQLKQSGPLKIVFYNTENSFDTINDPNKNDEDFLPTSKVAWTTERYNQKLNHIARVLVAIDSVNLPAIIGLAEIENIGVLKDLVDSTQLHKGNYGAILEEGSDPRGIDVALIYRKNVVKYINHKAFPSAQSFKTRSVLYVQLMDARRDTLHIFVNHWKSRTGGATETEPQRIENAKNLRHLTDSIRGHNQKANIIIMGDFNDEPINISISQFLGASKPIKKAIPANLYNLMYKRFQRGEGTLYYNDWDLFDQMIVSGNMLVKRPGKNAMIVSPYAYIFKADWLLYKNKTGTMVPNRTASSTGYFGGYSDHLPVYIEVNY